MPNYCSTCARGPAADRDSAHCDRVGHRVYHDMPACAFYAAAAVVARVMGDGSLRCGSCASANMGGEATGYICRACGRKWVLK